ncbi:MAG: hypothetical protein J6Y25_00650 [Elusimicrobiaceae bacterium]|nr:hypothetical protein [Elusimicrobiaceae bacterium]
MNRFVKAHIKYKHFQRLHSKRIKNLRLCFIERGGLGDCLLLFPFIVKMQQQAPYPLSVDLYSKFGSLFSKVSCLNRSELIPNRFSDLFAHYDVVFFQQRFPKVLSANWPLIEKHFPKLALFMATERKLQEDSLLYDNLHIYNEWTALRGCRRFEQMDPYHVFGIDSQWKYPTPNADTVLNKFNLKAKHYITLSRATDSAYNDQHPKLWPLTYYNELIKLLKQEFPSLQLVQVGASAKYGVMTGIHQNLVGKTNLEEIATILQQAVLHIDGEGGLVHLNHVVGGKSCVLFGPTSPSVFGYPGNINLCNAVCPSTCDWVTNRWIEQCMKGKTPAPCMLSLTPDFVMQKIKEEFNPSEQRAATLSLQTY